MLCDFLILTTLFPIGLNQIEKAKQDDALSDLSNLLGELKGMAVDMGTEIERSVALTMIHRSLHTKLLLFSIR